MTTISLLSDLGYNDTGVAHVRSAIQRQLPDAVIIDFSHEIQPFYLQQAAYYLASAVAHATPKSFTLILYNVYYASAPTFIITEVDGHYIIAPDNGILPLAIGHANFEAWRCTTIDRGKSLHDIIPEISAIVNDVANNGIKQAGLQLFEADTASLQSLPKIYNDLIECFAVHIDRFGNVVLNLRQQEFEQARKDRSFAIQFIRDENITGISEHYNDVPIGEKLCRFNSAGFMEIAIRNDKASGLFGFKMVDERKQGYDTIKIRFNDHTNSEDDFRLR